MQILLGDRSGLPSEPGRCFFQDLALLLESLHLTAKTAELSLLFCGQSVLAFADMAGVRRGDLDYAQSDIVARTAG